MGLFGKKKECDICGKKLGFFGSVALSDGIICDDCLMKAEIARGDISGRKESISSISWYLKGFDKEKKELAARYGEGKGVFKAVSTGTVSLEEILVGLPAARALNGLVCVYGYIMSGTFRERREAVIIHGDLKIPVNIMAVCAGNEKDDLNLLIAKDQPKNPVTGPAKVKLILDIHNEDMISAGDHIITK